MTSSLHTRRALGLACAGLIAIGATSVAQARPPFPALNLAGESRGEAAVQALGSRLPDVAAHYGISAERLRTILRKDASSRLDARGRLFYVERGVQEAGTAEPSVSEAAPYDLPQTFNLHSKPGSQRVLYLDFNGHTATNTAWASGSTINAQPYDTDGNPDSFSAAEQEVIQKVWQRLAEDYAPFDVNVTTADPGVDAIHRTSSADTLYGTRVVITPNTFYNCSCGGVAYVGTFDYYNSSNPGQYQPAWVFSDALGNGEKNIAEAAAHEAGHNLGLNHDGTATTGYYSGHGSGETAWAPIMGVGYYRNLSQWSQGEYSGANNLQDDLAIIAQHGAVMRADDAGNTTASAATLGGTSSNGSVAVNRAGLIGQRSDSDVYAFFTGSGTVQLNVMPAALGPNLDLRADLLDSNGNVVASANPLDTLGASLSVSVSGGSYYLRVDGVGKGDPATAYSDYGSLGAYHITGSYPDTGAAAPQAALTAGTLSGVAPLATNFDGRNSSDADGSIVSYAWNFGDGSTASGDAVAHTYTSAGTFTVTLTVTDDQGLTDTDSVVVNVQAATQVIYVQSVAVTSAPVKGGYQCTSVVTVQNDSGGMMSGVSVSGAWSGSVGGSATVTSGSNGQATFKSSKSRKHGSCTFSVNTLSGSGSTYLAERNLQTGGSATF